MAGSVRTRHLGLGPSSKHTMERVDRVFLHRDNLLSLMHYRIKPEPSSVNTRENGPGAGTRPVGTLVERV